MIYMLTNSMTTLNQKAYGLTEKNNYTIAAITHDLSAANASIEKYLGSYFILPGLELKENFQEIKKTPWLFKYDPENNDVIKHDYHMSETNIENYKFLGYQIKALEHIVSNLNVHKNRYRENDADFTSLILLKKQQEAEKIKNGESFSINSHPYVYEYALALDMSVDDAVEDILIKSKLLDHDLSMIEGMRLKYFKEILNSDISIKLKEIIVNFNKECWFNNK
jgi:hypothetical protein